jgi:hypothetical protein
MRKTNHMSVRDHLVEHHGFTPMSAADLVRRQTGIVQEGMRSESSLDDVADKVLAAEGHRCNDKCQLESDDERCR